MTEMTRVVGGKVSHQSTTPNTSHAAPSSLLLPADSESPTKELRSEVGWAPSRRQALGTLLCVATVLLVTLCLAGTAVVRQSGQERLLPIPKEVGRVASIRLLPGDDLIEGVMSYVRQHRMRSAWIVSCVGSLHHYNIRFANQPGGFEGTGHFEIVSMVGTMTAYSTPPAPPPSPPTPSPPTLLSTATDVRKSHPPPGPLGGKGAWHLHISIGDETGHTVSGHLLGNSTLYTTAEVVIGFDCFLEYYRGYDGSTPWDELQIVKVPTSWC